jgi:hypothetical protein
MSLTGKFRYRKTFFGKLILQVEERLSFTARRRVAMSTGCAYRWRDATTGDLDELYQSQLFQSEVERRQEGDMWIRPIPHAGVQLRLVR